MKRTEAKAKACLRMYLLLFLREWVGEARGIKLKASGSEVRSHKDRGACCIKRTSASKQLFGLCFMEDADFKQILIFCTGCQSTLSEAAGVYDAVRL